MREENKKERLTKNNIEYDIKSSSINELKSAFAILFLILLLIFITKTLNLTTNGAIGSDKFGIVVISISLFLLFLIFVLVLIKCINQLVCLKSKKYTIVKDRLIDLKSGTGPIVSSNMRAAFYRPCRLYFSQKKRMFKIPEGKNYKWSEKYCMYEYNVLNSSNVGDEFYLVIVNEKKVLSVYNTKLFELEVNEF